MSGNEFAPPILVPELLTWPVRYVNVRSVPTTAEGVYRNGLLERPKEGRAQKKSGARLRNGTCRALMQSFDPTSRNWHEAIEGSAVLEAVITSLFEPVEGSMLRPWVSMTTSSLRIC